MHVERLQDRRRVSATQRAPSEAVGADDEKAEKQQRYRTADQTAANHHQTTA